MISFGRFVPLKSLGTYHPASWGSLEEKQSAIDKRTVANHGIPHTLLVVTTRDLEQVALELVAEGVTGDLFDHQHCSSHPLSLGLTSVPMRFSMKGRSLRSSSTSRIFCDPLAG